MMSEATLCAVMSEFMQQVTVSETTKVSENYPSTLFFSSQDANTIHFEAVRSRVANGLEPESLYYFVLS